MTSTATLRRTQEKVETWSNIFPQDQVTETQSAVFVKKLLAVAVSNVTYLRNIFPEQAFADRNLDDLHLKILRDDSCCPGACQVIRWMKGCFDALEKKYLRVLIMGLYLNPDNPESIFESYTFKFSYLENGGIDIYRNDKKISTAHSAAETKKATVRMLRTIVVLTQTLQSLPDNVMMTMKLHYYDEVTPSDYEPPGFKPCDSEGFFFEDEAMNLKVGDVATPFHTLKLRIKTNANQFEFQEKESAVAMETKEAEEAAPKPSTSSQEIQHVGLDHDEDAAMQEQETAEPHGMTTLAPAAESSRQEADPQSAGDQNVPQPLICDDVPHPLDTPARPKSAEHAVVPSAGSSINSLSTNRDQEQDHGVRCPCGCNEDDGLMVFCAVCNYWQHAVCFRILDEDSAPDRHVCCDCADPDDANLKPTDPQLCGLNEIALQATCLWRRALMACLELGRVVLPKLACRLGVEMAVAQGIMKRLENEGFIKTSAKGKRLGKAVNKGLIQDVGILKYFKQSGTSPKKNFNLSDRFEMCKKIPSSQDPKMDEQIEMIADKTHVMSLSGLKPRPMTPSSIASQMSQEIEYNKPNQRRQSPRIQADKAASSKPSAKRVHALSDASCEFEISNSQDTQPQDQGRAKRKRYSVVTRPIMV